MPKFLRDVGYAQREFSSHTKQLLAKERAKSTGSTDNNLMSVIVKVSDEGKKEKHSKTSLYLEEDEITGNLFQFTIS